MMRMTLEASRRSAYLTTCTSGLIARIDSSAESTFGTPTRSVVWMTWRWRLERSTTSLSTMPIVPTPAAARERAVAGRAVEDHALRAVGDGALDAGLQVAARDVLGTRDVALVPLLGLAHVDDRHAVVEVLVNGRGIDLGDLLLDLADEVGAGGRHDVNLPNTSRVSYFRKYSEAAT